MDFSESFSNGQILDFEDIFPIRATSTKDHVYLVKEFEHGYMIAFMFALMDLLYYVIDILAFEALDLTIKPLYM